MYEIRQTDDFREWYSRLADVRGRARIRARIIRLAQGHISATQDPSAMVWASYASILGRATESTTCGKDVFLVILLCGDKGSQDRDIKWAKMMAAEWKE